MFSVRQELGSPMGCFAVLPVDDGNRCLGTAIRGYLPEWVTVCAANKQIAVLIPGAFTQLAPRCCIHGHRGSAGEVHLPDVSSAETVDHESHGTAIRRPERRFGMLSAG